MRANMMIKLGFVWCFVNTAAFALPSSSPFNLSLPGCKRCSLGNAPIPVYIYPPLWSYRPEHTNPYLVQMVEYLTSAASSEAVRTLNPDDACVYLVTHPAAAICNQSRMDCGFWDMAQRYPFEQHMPYWRGDGRNHLSFMTWHTDWSLPSFDVGEAVLMRSAATRATFRSGHDVQVPFYSPVCNATARTTCNQKEQVPGRGACYAPDWVAAARNQTQATPRDLLLTFVGSLRIAAPFAVPAADLTVGNRLRVVLTTLHDPGRGVIVADAEDPVEESDAFAAVWPSNSKLQGSGEETSHLRPDHDRRLAFERAQNQNQHSDDEHAEYHNSEGGRRWKHFYWGTHLRSHYALCPGGAGAHSQRLNEALAAGAVPVVFHADDIEVLPFEDHPEVALLWHRCAIQVGSIDGADGVLKTLIHLLESHLRGEFEFEGDRVEDNNATSEQLPKDWRWQQRRAACEKLHTDHFSSHDKILDSAFRQIALRLRRQNYHDQNMGSGSDLASDLRPPPPRVQVRDIPGFNGAWPGEETPFPARERTASLQFGRIPRAMTWQDSSPPWRSFTSSASLQMLMGGSPSAPPLIGSYMHGLVALQQRILQFVDTVKSRGQRSIDDDGDMKNPGDLHTLKVHLQTRLFLVTAALGEEAAHTGQLNVATAAYDDCRGAYTALLETMHEARYDAGANEGEENRLGSSGVGILAWAPNLCGWCTYVSGLLAERRSVELEPAVASTAEAAKIAEATLNAVLEVEKTTSTWGEWERADSTMASVELSFQKLRADETSQQYLSERRSASEYYADAIRLAPSEASRWTQLRDGKPISSVVEINTEIDHAKDDDATLLQERPETTHKERKDKDRNN